jgi:hypothetical protein
MLNDHLSFIENARKKNVELGLDENIGIKKKKDLLFYIDIGREYDETSYPIKVVKEQTLQVSALTREDQNKIFQRQLMGYIGLSHSTIHEKIQLDFFLSKELLDVFHIQDLETWKVIMGIIYGKLKFGLTLNASISDSVEYTINESKKPDSDGDSM